MLPFRPGLAGAAYKLITEVIPVREGEEVVITCDPDTDPSIADATAQAVYAKGAHPIVIWYESLPHPCMEPPKAVAAALAAADVWIEYAAAYLLYSSAQKAASRAGCRYICLPGMYADLMVRAIGQVNCRALRAMEAKLHQLSQNAKSVLITSRAGTNLTMEVNPEVAPSDLPYEEGRTRVQMLAGQASFTVLAESFSGRLVIDGSLWPPAELGILRSPVALTVEKGHIEKIEGGYEAESFRNWLESFEHPAMLRLDHVCYGFNPGVRKLTGCILEDERLFGCVEIGIGRTSDGAPSHSDGVLVSPSVWADGLQLQNEGRYTHPELIRLCRQMGIPGY
ncbi:MAG: hypothetical protein ACUVV0_00220 [Anaerolineae bacterium]